MPTVYREDRVTTYTYDAVNQQVEEDWLSDGSPIHTTHYPLVLARAGTRPKGRFGARLLRGSRDPRFIAQRTSAA